CPQPLAFQFSSVVRPRYLIDNPESKFTLRQWPFLRRLMGSLIKCRRPAESIMLGGFLQKETKRTEGRLHLSCLRCLQRLRLYPRPGRGADPDPRFSRPLAHRRVLPLRPGLGLETRGDVQPAHSIG